MNIFDLGSMISAKPERLEEHLRVSSEHVFEIKQRLTFEPHINTMSYGFEMYFFVPTALQVTPDAFSSAALLRTLKNYIRLNAKSVALASFLLPKGPLDDLRASIQIINPEAKGALSSYEAALKKFAMTVRRSVGSEQVAILQATGPARFGRIAAYEETLREILRQYRGLSETCASLESKLRSRAFSYCDEFMSTSISRSLLEVMKGLEEGEERALKALLESERAWRKSHYPEGFPSETIPAENILFRWSLLKKFVNSFLYLEAKLVTAKPMLLHSLYGVAAAISMFAVTSVSFSWRDGGFSHLTIWLVAAILLSYIFKDRIQETLKSWLFTRFEKWIPDRRLSLVRNGQNTGSVHESFRFLAPNQLPDIIRGMREEAHTVKFLSDRIAETILLYKKQVRIENVKLIVSQTSNSIFDLTRFNIRDVLKYADTYLEELPLPEEEPGASAAPTSALAEKIYHIYVARRVFLEEKTGYDLVRLVISTKGIKRFEVVTPLRFS